MARGVTNRSGPGINKAMYSPQLISLLAGRASDHDLLLLTTIFHSPFPTISLL